MSNDSDVLDFLATQINPPVQPSATFQEVDQESLDYPWSGYKHPSTTPCYFRAADRSGSDNSSEGLCWVDLELHCIGKRWRNRRVTALCLITSTASLLILSSAIDAALKHFLHSSTATFNDFPRDMLQRNLLLFAGFAQSQTPELATSVSIHEPLTQLARLTLTSMPLACATGIIWTSSLVPKSMPSSRRRGVPEVVKQFGAGCAGLLAGQKLLAIQVSSSIFLTELIEIGSVNRVQDPALLSCCIRGTRC